MKAMMKTLYLCHSLQLFTHKHRLMDNQDGIPLGIANATTSPQQANYPPLVEPLQPRAINQTTILDQIIIKPSQAAPLRTDSHFRHRTTREDSRSREKNKNKATSEYNNIKTESKEEQTIPKRSSSALKKHKESLHLPQGLPKNHSGKLEHNPKEMHSKSHHFNRKEYHNQQIIKDIDKHPLKYKIMCEVFGCKPDVAFEMKKDEASYIQEGYMKKKGMEYLREGNSRARYNYIRDRRVHTESNPKNNHTHSSHKLNIKGSKSSKLLKLTAKQAIEGKVVYQRVRKHLKEGEKSHNYFKHLTSQESIDQALVNFLKTKIKRAQIVLK